MSTASLCMETPQGFPHIENRSHIPHGGFQNMGVSGHLTPVIGHCQLSDSMSLPIGTIYIPIGISLFKCRNFKV